MSRKRPKSKISFRNLLRNRKTAIVAGICCVAAIGVYVGMHLAPSKAGNDQPVRGIVNDISELDGKIGGRDGLGTPDNPFVLLEIVPWQYYSEMSYMIEGCEPFDVYNMYTGTSTQGLNAMQVGNVVDEVFPEEDYPGKGKTKEEFPDKWTLSDTESTINGYYEKVAGTSVKGHFNIVGTETGSDGKEHPVFGEAEDGAWIWVSLKASDSKFKIHKNKENINFEQGTTPPEMNDRYVAGDREYTTRTGKTYQMGSMPTAVSVFRHYNDFLRYSLKLRTKEEVDNFSIVVKPIEPSELNEHPEWVDYADLIYIHTSSEYGATSETFAKDATEAQTRIKTPTTTGKGATFGYFGNGKWATKQNDISWEVAEKLFLKGNALGEYDGSQSKTIRGHEVQLGYAPIVLASAVYTEAAAQGYDKITDSPSKMLNYEDMTIVKDSGTSGTAYNNNFYKFCIMDLLMDQDTFYSLFFSNLDTTGKPVIQNINGEGVCTPQEGKAQTYWNANNFLPYHKNHWIWDDDLLDKYGLNFNAGSFMNFPGNTAIRDYTYVYNNNGSAFYLSDQAYVEKNGFTGDAFDWFENEHNEQKDNLSTLDIIFYMLNYKKGDDNTNGSRKKATLRILDLEPCSDFSKLTDTYLRSLFPASKYKCTFKVDHMTTAEFNGSKKTLNASYDVIFVGKTVGKFNTDNDTTKYNDSTLNKKAYLHVGDLVENGSKKYRTSGDDITSIRKDDLVSYVKSGNYLLFDDVLYVGKSSQDYKDAVVLGSNIDKLVNAVRSESNVKSLSSLEVKNIIGLDVNGAEVKITSTPGQYRNEVKAITSDDEEDDSKKNHLAPLDGNKLTFKFSIGYSKDENETFAVKFLVDTNGDGVISDKENGAETVDTWSMESSAGTTFKPGTRDEEGNEVPAEYTVSYTIPSDRTNGPIAWKFVIYSTANENIYYEKSGVSLYRGNEKENEDGEKKATVNEVRVLQVVDTGKESTQANLEEELKKSGLFGSFANNIKDYKITVKTIPLKNGNDSGDFEKMGYLDSFQYVKDHEDQYPKFAKGGDYSYPSAYLEDYNVYLFSCGDTFQKADNSNGAVAFAAWLADNGKSVVYTHDSIYDAEGSANVTALLKDSSGLSRFSSSSSTTSEYNDTPTYDNKKSYKLSDYNSLEYTYHKAVLEGATSNQYLPYSNELWQTVNGDAVTYNTGKQKSKKASQSNLGTVCIYPYTIDEEIDLQGSVGQDFQLNLENPMADAWYCLGQDNDGDNNTFYSISPNDAANNYYLFNVENVFYSGVDLEKVEGDQEMQLFINTLIGAYEASYADPYVEVDRIHNQETDKNEELSLTKFSSLSDEEREAYEKRGIERIYETTLSGVGEKVVETTRYREYVKQEEENAILKVTPKPTATTTPEPEETDEPDDPSPTPAVPSATPITVYEAGNVEVEYPSCIAKDTDWMKNLSNDAIIQISYYCTEEVDGDSLVFNLYGGQYEWDKWSGHSASLTACTEGSDSSKKTQTVTMTIGDLKEIFGLSEDQDLGYFELTATQIWTNGWTNDNPNPVRLLAVRVYTDAGSIGSGGSGEDAKEADEVTVKKADIFKGGSTHAIYFTPHDGNLVGGKIRSFTINFVDEKGYVLLPITKIYRKTKDGKYKMLESPEGKPGQFTIEDNLFLTDNVQYFIPYNKEDANPANDNPFDKIAFTIKNKKRQSTSLLNITGDPEVKTKNKDVYMFDLD